MSNNAVAAYEDGEMPLSKWTKTSIIAMLDELGVDPAIISKAKQLNVKALKDIFLYKSSWHHTSKMYNRTNFYSVNPDVTMADIDKYIADNSANTSKEEPNPYKFCSVTYGEWEGSKRHPKLVEYEDYAIVIDNWAYVYNNGAIKKKKVSGSHFSVDYTYSKIPDNLTSVYESIVKFIK